MNCRRGNRSSDAAGFSRAKSNSLHLLQVRPKRRRRREISPEP